MGAFGCALYAREMALDKSTLIGRDELENFSYTSKSAQCGGCTANCQLNIISFGKGRNFISGNRCEKGSGKAGKNNLPNLYEYKYDSILNITKSGQPANPIAKVGLPLALSFYEQLPFWHTFFTELGFETVISDESSRDMYYLGQHTIPSDTVCYPAKLTHGHIENLLNKGVDFIFYPCMSYNIDEGESDNHFNCPVVAYYPELLLANNPRLNEKNFLHPYMDLNVRKNVVKVLSKSLKQYNIKGKISDAVDKAFLAMDKFRSDTAAKAQEIITRARAEGRNIIVIAGRPYHIDKEINHGIHKLIASLGMAVVTEDSVAQLAHTPELGVLNQWTYHARLYRAAEYVTSQPDMQLIQLVSFGCGIDAVTTDEVRAILESKGKLYTQLKIDEINNLGAAKIRLRSLAAAIENKKKENK
jgi:predicted nucleotide-binding protein (sugar kinase/HSP70/actin superfamily)